MVDSKEGVEGFNQETDEFLEEEFYGGEEDLLLQQSDREENVLQFLQALDLQVIGACRADERLIPLLKTNVSNSPAEDRLLAHLIQYFEAQEIGMLARCLCMPLVSIRVGRINKQGNLLCPTSSRGNLNLTLLPSSNLRISFTGDDGCSERLATLSSNCKNAVVTVEEIPADTSGRSFMLKLPKSRAYFWCSEKSMLLGHDLLAKMKDVVERKPSLAELTGISESRLDCFAVHFREYLLGSTNQIGIPVVTTLDTAAEPSEVDSSFQVLMAHCDMGVASIGSEGSTPPWLSLEFSESQGKPASSLSLSPDQLLQGLPWEICSCPPCTSEVATTNSFAEPFLLPPLSSFLLSGSSRSLNSFAATPHNLIDVSSFDLSAFLGDPVVQVPLSISLATSQQIPTFTPFTCDPIVHIPAIAVCSSGQGYVVVPPLIQEPESMVEKGARETLQLLLNSAQTNPWSRDAFLTSDVDETSIGAMEFAPLPHKVVCDFDSSNQGVGSEGLKGSHSDDVNTDALG